MPLTCHFTPTTSRSVAGARRTVPSPHAMLVALGLALLVVIATPAAHAEEPPGEASAAFLGLLGADPTRAAAALVYLDQNWHEGFVAMGLDIMRFLRTPTVAATLVSIMERRTGESHGFDLDGWYRAELLSAKAYAHSSDWQANILQMTDARPDTGGLSGATPSEAVSWGKGDPEALADTVVCYLDVSVGLPLMTAYALARHAARTPKRLYDRRAELMARLTDEYEGSR